MEASFFTPSETDNKGKAGFFLNYDMDVLWCESQNTSNVLFLQKIFYTRTWIRI